MAGKPTESAICRLKIVAWASLKKIKTSPTTTTATISQQNNISVGDCENTAPQQIQSIGAGSWA